MEDIIQKVTLTLEDLKDYKSDHGIKALPYIGYEKCYECAVKIVQGELNAEQDYVYVSPHCEVNKIFYVMTYCTNLDTEPFDTDEGRIALYDYVKQYRAELSNSDKLSAESFIYVYESGPNFKVIMDLRTHLEVALIERVNPMRLLAKALEKAASPLSAGDAGSIDQMKALSEQLLDLVNNKRTPEIEKPKTTVVNFAKRTV